MIRRPSFFSIFAKSPFKRLEKHMRVVHECVSLLPGFYDLCQAGEWEKAEKVAKKISSLESDADALKRKLQVRLHADLYLPVPRTDVLALLQVQDNIANQAEDVMGLMMGRKMVFPDAVKGSVRLLLAQMIKTCNKALDVNGEMRDLLEAGFDGVVLKMLEEMVTELDALEDEADQIQAKIRQEIFQIESQHNPVDVLFWYHFVKELSAVIDWAQRVGTQLIIISSR
ncbi:TIGR00153 family protein [Candidatus Synchoanobacter obligatus]|uniref:TIGR00153 family protein n=1 Tax=Candidatus Synchoanobacter obligatus TaxID=2919597 RepID=A0ABT1L6W9_9GAMM|nr:TIGR00153 family protein [Candidatus Synchoanobacter obligatus]MCP8352153.1 TIGR00153 family protein [Candidatus Synchoanobacter obligatus]